MMVDDRGGGERSAGRSEAVWARIRHIDVIMGRDEGSLFPKQTLQLQAAAGPDFAHDLAPRRRRARCSVRS
jgi:hypothetical protein